MYQVDASSSGQLSDRCRGNIMYDQYVDLITHALKGAQASKANTNGRLEGGEIGFDEALHEWVELTQACRTSEKMIYFCGNGASAMMASHMAADATKNGGLRAQSFNDAALMTAISNDIAYEKVFSLPVERFASKDDMLITISSSGGSPNIIDAIQTAREKGLKVVTLSGKNESNPSRKLGDLNFYIPSPRYGIVECAHQVLLHCWLDTYLDQYGNGAI